MGGLIRGGVSQVWLKHTCQGRGQIGHNHRNFSQMAVRSICSTLFMKPGSISCCVQSLATSYKNRCFSVEADPFVYTRVVVRGGVASTLPASSLRLDTSSLAVNLEKARDQQKEYVEVLRGLVKEVHVLPVDDRYPDCVFVEDPVVVCGDTAFLPILGHEHRRGEGEGMKKMMQHLGLKIVEMVEPGRLDGGDVLFTGREFFVGQSKRTNASALAQLAAAFPAYPVTGISITNNLHLKSFLSMAGPDLITISAEPEGVETRKAMEEKGHFKYQFYEIPDGPGANSLYFNNNLVHASKDWLPKSYEKYMEMDTHAKKIPLSGSELNKVDGCFSCSSVFIK